MNKEHSIIYVMRHIDSGGHIKIPYKKVGITGSGNATLNSRLQQISNTKSPIKAQYVAAWKYDDAQKLEKALHSLFENFKAEGEWFYDEEDNLVERMQPIMELLAAEIITIEVSDDDYTKKIMQKETKEKEKSDHILLGEISGFLTKPLRSSSRKTGPTFYSENKKLTYYINASNKGNHNLSIGRSKDMHNELKGFILKLNYDVDLSPKGNTRVKSLDCESIAKIINAIENSFIATI